MKQQKKNQNSKILIRIGRLIICSFCLWSCDNPNMNVQPNDKPNTSTSTIGSNLDTSTVIGQSMSDTFKLNEDWNDDTIQLGSNYDLVRFVEIEKDMNGSILWVLDKKLIYENGRLKNSAAGNLVYNSDGKVISVLEADYYRASKIFSNASYMSNGWLKSFNLTEGISYPMGSHQAQFNYNFDINNKIQNIYGNTDTISYIYNNSINLPIVVSNLGNYYGNTGVFYKYIKIDSLIYNSLGAITDIYFGYIQGNLTSSSLNFPKPTMKLTSSTEYSGYKMGKASKFLVWYDLVNHMDLYNYMYFPPNYVETYNNGYFFSSRIMVDQYTLDQSTFKTNAKGDVIEINRVKTEHDGKKKFITQRFKYGNI